MAWGALDQYGGIETMKANVRDGYYCPSCRGPWKDAKRKGCKKAYLHDERGDEEAREHLRNSYPFGR